MANDDFDGALFALPNLRGALSPARGAAREAAARLATEIDRQIGAAGPARNRRTLNGLRRISIAAGQRLLHESAHVIEHSFDARIAAHRAARRFVIGSEIVALLIGGAFVAFVWNVLRRRERAELDRAHERAARLQTQLARRNAERALWTTPRVTTRGCSQRARWRHKPNDLRTAGMKPRLTGASLRRLSSSRRT